jgi:glyoxylase-like metal-dependent hydrolase (beta-lactamase superfamily II)
MPMNASAGTAARATAALAGLGATEIAPRVWRWTAFHPQWHDDVASVALVGGDDLVLVDPLLPNQRRAQEFWRLLDENTSERRRPLKIAVVLTVYWHRRSACQIVSEHPGAVTANLWVHEDGKDRIDCPVTRPFRPGDRLPAGLIAMPTARGAEIVLWLPRARALITGDVLLGGKRKPLRVCPKSWLPGQITRRDLARSLQPLLALPVQRVLCSHGEPIVVDAHATLAAAIRDAA